ncbi:hypothetical protein ALT_9177 [Aspergillus lentulus]|uniref:Uncharacterized protein n=1 Tax=Aspergillus lentulus TaxID=293939 RepID=A0AAN4TEK1_ASPLE|nr:hypothetical protein ALT_9177 [Aspergillus lentulus]
MSCIKDEEASKAIPSLKQSPSLKGLNHLATDGVYRSFSSSGEGAEPQQDDPAGVVEQAENSEVGNGRIIIHDNEPRLQKIAKAEQWCKLFLGVTEADYTWCIQLGDTYACVLEYDAASEQYKKMGKSLALRRIGRVLTWDDRLPQFSKLSTA